MKIYDDQSADIIDQRLAHLGALLHAISGEGFKPFSNMNDDLQADYLWACATLIDEVIWHMKHPDEHLQRCKAE